MDDKHELCTHFITFEDFCRCLTVLHVNCEMLPQMTSEPISGKCRESDKSSLCIFAGWAHVVCALYIPEVEFANVSTMEPIVLQSVPHERYNKVTNASLLLDINKAYV